MKYRECKTPDDIALLCAEVEAVEAAYAAVVAADEARAAAYAAEVDRARGAAWAAGWDEEFGVEEEEDIEEAHADADLRRAALSNGRP